MILTPNVAAQAVPGDNPSGQSGLLGSFGKGCQQNTASPPVACRVEGTLVVHVGMTQCENLVAAGHGEGGTSYTWAAEITLSYVRDMVGLDGQYFRVHKRRQLSTVMVPSSSGDAVLCGICARWQR